MKNCYKYIFICFLCFSSLWGNTDSDSLGFVSPVDHQIRLTGNFMEIRTNHFHAGIDIKSSKGVPGDNIRSVQDGFVSRIKVQSGSYGQALYIDHPNGYTSVYAHLDSYNAEIESYLKSIQYDVESFAVDIYLPDSIIMVKKGQIVGKMGNTGRSFGPHLHFELRKTETEIPVNPELLGLGPKDNITPTLESLSIYNIKENNVVDKTTTKYFKKENSNYSLYDKVVEVDCDKVAFGIQGYDQMNGSSNKNGIYNLRVTVDDQEYYNWTASDFSFSDSKKINGFIDYEKRKTFGQKVYKLHEPYCAAMSNIRTFENGIIELNGQKERQVEIVATDIYGNAAKLNFLIKGKLEKGDSSKPAFSCDTSIYYEAGMFGIEFPPKTLFSPLSKAPSSTTEKIGDQKCHKVNIGKSTKAVSRYYSIDTPIPSSYNEQWTFVAYDNKKRLVNFGGDTLNGKMFTEVDQLGSFYTYKDDAAPTYQIINLEASMLTPWKVVIKDNLIPDGHVPDLYFRATVNGQWICMNYDLKNNILIFDDFERLPQNVDLIFELIISDDQGNSKKLTRAIKHIKH